MLEQQKSAEKFTKEKVAVLLIWFGVLIGTDSFLLGFMLENMWVGTIGAVAVTFVIFYVTLRYTGLQKHRQLINSSLMLCYRKNSFI